MILLKHISAATVCVAAISVLSQVSAASLDVSLGGGNSGDADVSATATVGNETSANVDINLGGGDGGNAVGGNGTAGNITGNANIGDGVDAYLGIGRNVRATGALLGSDGDNTATLNLSGLGIGNVADLGIIDIDILGGGATGATGGGNAVASVGRSGGGGSGGIAMGGGSCSIPQGRQVLQLAANAEVDVSAWQRAANVSVVPVKLCPSTKAQVAKVLRMSPKMNALQGAAASDTLISASLSRTQYDASDVFAVARNNGQLTVYVY